MPGLSLAKTSPRVHRASSLALSADQAEAVRQLVGCTTAQVECELIIETLIAQAGSRTSAARVLGISIRTLRNKINEYSARGKILPRPGIQMHTGVVRKSVWITRSPSA
jgi:DNA-binding NtrC family response regulator